MISAKFHQMPSPAILGAARRLRKEKVIFSGGFVRNRHVADRTMSDLQAPGLQPIWHQRIPPNDAGISFRQAIATSWLARA